MSARPLPVDTLVPELLAALQSAPIPGRNEEMMSFRDRQDKWLREIYGPAVAKATKAPVPFDGSLSDALFSEGC